MSNETGFNWKYLIPGYGCYVIKKSETNGILECLYDKKIISIEVLYQDLMQKSVRIIINNYYIPPATAVGRFHRNTDK